MKTASVIVRSAIAVVFAFVMSSASCDLFDKVDDVTINVILDHTFTVNEEEENPEGKSYSKFEVLDAADVNSDFNKYKDKIKTITVTKVTYTIQNCQTEDLIFEDGVIGFSALSNPTSASQVATVGIENISTAEGTETTLPFSQAAIDELSNLLKNDKKANLWLLGKFATTPAQFDVLVKVEASITADAL